MSEHWELENAEKIPDCAEPLTPLANSLTIAAVIAVCGWLAVIL